MILFMSVGLKYIYGFIIVDEICIIIINHMKSLGFKPTPSILRESV